MAQRGGADGHTRRTTCARRCRSMFGLKHAFCVGVSTCLLVYALVWTRAREDESLWGSVITTAYFAHAPASLTTRGLQGMEEIPDSATGAGRRRAAGSHDDRLTQPLLARSFHRMRKYFHQDARGIVLRRAYALDSVLLQTAPDAPTDDAHAPWCTATPPTRWWTDETWAAFTKVCNYMRMDAPDALHIAVAHIRTRDRPGTHGSGRMPHTRLCTLLADVRSHTRAFIHLHLIVDRHTLIHDSGALQVLSPPLRSLCVHVYDADMFTDSFADVRALNAVFEGLHTQDRVDDVSRVWLLKSWLFELLPPSVPSVVVLDTDMRVGGDLHAWLHNDTLPRMRRQGAALALVTEALPTYLLVGLPTRGFNGGLQVHDLARMRARDCPYASALRRFQWPGEAYPNLHVTASYGDQTLYTVLSLTHPSLVLELPCVWNRQLCRGWMQRYLPGSYGLQVTERQWCEYERGFSCLPALVEPVRVVHGSCSHMRPGSRELDGSTAQWQQFVYDYERAHVWGLQPCGNVTES